MFSLWLFKLTKASFHLFYLLLRIVVTDLILNLNFYNTIQDIIALLFKFGTKWAALKTLNDIL